MIICLWFSAGSIEPRSSHANAYPKGDLVRPTSRAWRPPSYHPLRKIRTAITGIQRAVLLDFSVRYKLILSAAFLLIAAAFESVFHFLFVLTVTGLMLVAEMLNTAVETICDFIQPEHDERIKNIKDIAAGAAIIAIVIWCAVLLTVSYELVTAQELFSSGKSLILRSPG